MQEYKQEQISTNSKLKKKKKMITAPKTENLDKIESILSEDWKDAYDRLPRDSKRNAWRIIIKQITVRKDRSISYTING